MPKKTKAIKHGDKKQGKAWLRKTKSSNYRIEEVETNKMILIVCEGQTEKLYFESFEVFGLTVKAVDLGGQANLALVDATLNITKSSDVQYDEVWCVFDMDVNRGESEFADFDSAIVKAERLGYKVAYSNDSFELWFYLHYQYTEQQHLRTFYYEQLGNFWDLNYEKEGKKYSFAKSIYNRLSLDEKALLPSAIKNAEKLYNNQKHLPYHKQNPVTTVFLLVGLLTRNVRR